MKKLLSFILVFWFLSIIASIIWSFENPEKVEKLKDFFKKKKKIEVNIPKDNIIEFNANSFDVEIEQVLDLNDKTAFVINKQISNKFNVKDLEIYTQTGNLIKNLKSKKLILPKSFTLQRNGGVKTIIYHKNERIALISNNEKNCFFASLFSLNDNQELFRTKCLPEIAKNNDFNGLGSSNVHLKDSILFSLGTPEKHKSKNSSLAQMNNSKFGKILEIDKLALENKIKNKKDELKIKIYSKGHRVPQGLTILNGKIFNVEHGPKGGDELNRVIKGNNYGWPLVSYGTNYLKDSGGDGASFKINHEANGFTEPLFAFVPSVGISNLNNCPKTLKDYYKKTV